jgi:hypothetical protein
MISASTRALAQPSPLSPLAAPPEPPKASLPIAPTPQNRILINGGPLKGGTKGGIMAAAFGLPRACCCAQKRTVLRAALVGCARGLRWTSVVVPCRSRGRRYPDIGGVQPPEVGANESGISPSFFSPPFGVPSLRPVTSRRAGAKGKFRASGFNLKHSVGLLLVIRRRRYPHVKVLFLELIKRRTWRFFPYRKLVLNCF